MIPICYRFSSIELTPVIYRMTRFWRFTGIFAFLTLTWAHNVSSQIIPAGSLLDDQAELQSLINDSVRYSPVNRPLSANSYQTYVTGHKTDPKWWNRNLIRPIQKVGTFGEVGMLPLFFQIR
jgi:hypothetical protein